MLPLIIGLYNIALKSLGAAMKRNPDVPLGNVIDYSELMTESGYYFMNRYGVFRGYGVIL
jgi:altronate dehydratase